MGAGRPVGGRRGRGVVLSGSDQRHDLINHLRRGKYMHIISICNTCAPIT